MSGLIFLGTKILEEITSFYQELGMELWLDQGGCRILQQGNLLLGFCQRDESETCGMITFFLENRKDVDSMYQKLGKKADAAPRYNPNYDIYHFFSRDPEERIIEFQYFEHNIKEYRLGSENLMTRRSIRHFLAEKPDKEVLDKVFNICRYSPTSRNMQKYYYVVTDNQSKIKQLAKVRGSSSSPLAAAPLAVAVCSTPETRRMQQDSDIAATYFMLAAHSQGLATCWITDMDRLEVKEVLGIPPEDYISCLLPLGYAAETKVLPVRRSPEEFVKYV